MTRVETTAVAEPRRRRRGSDALRFAVAEAVESRGRLLDDELRRDMEARLGLELSGVRLHADVHADASARALDARAFTVGREVFFAASELEPETVDGRLLLAHELAHVAQQPGIDGAAALRTGAVELASEGRLEHEARTAAGGLPATPTLGVPPPGVALVHRLAEGAPVLEPSAPGADAFVERMARDIARLLERDPSDPDQRTRKRLARLAPETRTAVVGRTQALLPPTALERASPALTGAVAREEGEPPPAPEPEQRPPAAAEPETAVAVEAEAPAAEPAPPAPVAAATSPAPAPAEPVAEARPKGAEVEGAEAAEPPTPEGTAPAVPGERPAGPPIAAAAAGAAPAAAATAEADVPPDLSPVDEAERRIDERYRRREERARRRVAEHAEQTGAPAPPVDAGAGTPEPGHPAPAAPAAAAAEVGADEAASEVSQLATAAEAAPPAAPAPAATAQPPEGAAESAPDVALPPVPEPPGAPPEAPAEPAAGAAVAPPEEEPEPSPEEEAAPPPGVTEPSEPAPVSTAEQPAEPAAAAPAEPAAAIEPAGEPEAAAAPSEPESAAPAEPGAAGAAAPEAAAALVEESAAPGGAEPTEEPAAEGAAAGPAAEAPATAEGAPAEAAPETEAPPEGEPEVSAGPAGEETPSGEAEGTEPAAEAEGDGEAEGGAEAPAAGGGGGASPIEEQPPPEDPDVSQSEPADAMQAARSLPPGRMGRMLSRVRAAARGSVARQRSELAASPPSADRPSGAPQAYADERPAGCPPPPSAQAAAPALERAAERPAAAAPAPAPLPAAPPPPTQGVSAPPVGSATQGQVTANDAQAIAASVRALPVRDPALEVTAGPAPRVALEGDADPARAREQRASLDRSTADVHAQGRQDAAQPLGEDNVFPLVPHETLLAEVPAEAEAAEAEGGEAEGGGEGEAPDAAESAVAEEQSGDEVRGAAGSAQGEIVASREDHATRVVTHQRESQEQMDEETRRSSEGQATERERAQGAAARHRGDWNRAQQDAIDDNQRRGNDRTQGTSRQVEERRSQADRAAATHIDHGNQDADRHRRAAEQNATNERRRGEQRTQDTGFLGWLASKATAFFNEIKRGIQEIFDAARRAVRWAIEEAQRLAAEAIELARRAIVDLIREAAELLMSLADELLAAFPGLRDRFRRLICEAVEAAVAAVNRLANLLKEAIQRFLNLLGQLLDAALRLLMQAYLAAVNAVASAVRRAIQAARSFLQGLAAFMQVAKDIAAGPAQWIRNLAVSAMDGVRNHLWRAFKIAVKRWFRSKVEEVLGLPLMIFNLLRRGGIKLGQIASMVWKGIVAAIPGILIQLAIEKIVSLIIPAAALVMQIIEALQAAWGTISRIIAAIESFIRFLLAVKLGNAGAQFATMVANAAVVVLDFLANFLIRRLMRPARPVGGRLSAIAQRLAARFRRIAQAVQRGVRRVVQTVRRAVQAVRRVVVRAAQAVRRVVVRVARAVGGAARRVAATVARGARRAWGAITRTGGRVMRVIERRFPRVARVLHAIGRAGRRVGAGLRRGYQRARAWIQRQRERFRRWREDRKRRALERAEAELPPRLRSMLGQRPSRPRMWLTLQLWRVWYGLRRLALQRRGATDAVVAANSPERQLIADIVHAMGPELHVMLVEISEAVMNDPVVVERAERIMRQRVERKRGRDPRSPLALPSTPLAAARDIRNIGILAQAGVLVRGQVAGHPAWTAGAIGRQRIVPEQEYLALGRTYGTIATDVFVGPRSAAGTRALGRLYGIGPRTYRSLLDVGAGRPDVIARATHELTMGRTPTGLTVPEMSFAASLARVQQIEMARFSAGPATESMLSSLHARGAITFEQRTALSPAAMSGAGAAARRLDLETGLHYGERGTVGPERSVLAALHGTPGTREQGREYLNREGRLVVEFIYHEMQVVDHLALTRESIRQWLREKFRARLIEVMIAGELAAPSVLPPITVGGGG